MVPAIIDGGEGHEDREGRKKATGEALKRALWSPSVAGEAVSLPGWCGTILSGAIRAGGDPFHSEGGQAGVAIPIREPHKAIFFRASPAFEMEPIPTVPSRRPRKMSSFCGCAGHELQHVAYRTSSQWLETVSCAALLYPSIHCPPVGQQRWLQT